MVAPLTRRIGAARVAGLVAGFDRDPAYQGLAEALRVAIGDGRIGHDVRLPSERELTGVLAVSRTTVTRAYALLREHGFADARQGAGTYTRLPGGPARLLDRALSPRVDDGLIDLNCAAASATPRLLGAYQSALEDLPAYLSGNGYYPAGLPDLQSAVADRFTARGLPTEPDQIVVTPGALSATAITAHALVRPGDRVLVESPVYPNAPRAFASAGARLLTTAVGGPNSHLDGEGWDLDALTESLRRTAPRLAYLIPDFQNPTGRVMTDAARERLAAAVRASGTVVVVDEAHQELNLDGGSMPLPLAAHVERAGGAAIVVGGVSKTAWGGLRVGWLRAPRRLLDALTDARLSLDLGVPVVEQLVTVRLLADGEEVLGPHRERLREQRDALAEALQESLPQWRFRLPAGGLALWCALPRSVAGDFADLAERRGVVMTPGPVFAPEGGLNGYVRIPFTRPAEELRRAVQILAEAWAALSTEPDGRPRAVRAMVA